MIDWMEVTSIIVALSLWKLIDAVGRVIKEGWNGNRYYD